MKRERLTGWLGLAVLGVLGPWPLAHSQEIVADGSFPAPMVAAPAIGSAPVMMAGPVDTAGASGRRGPEQVSSILLWRTYHNNGWEALRANRLELAEDLFRAALKEAEKQGPSSANLATSYNNLGWIMLLKDKPADAEPLARWALQTREILLGANHPEVGDSLMLLARVLAAQEKFDEAEPFAQRGLVIYRRSSFGSEDRHPPYAFDVLGEIREGRGEFVEAEALYLKALNLREEGLFYVTDSFPAITEEDRAGSYRRLSRLLRKMGREDEADVLDDRAKEISAPADFVDPFAQDPMGGAGIGGGADPFAP